MKDVSPDYVTMENVSQLINFKLKPVFPDFLNTLSEEGYHVSWKVVFCPDYGIPQTRKRLVLLASKYSDIRLLPPTHTKDMYLTVGDTIRDLPAIHSGEGCIQDPLHRAISLSPLNLDRIKATPYGGSWRDWPDELILTCHKKKTEKFWKRLWKNEVGGSGTDNDHGMYRIWKRTFRTSRTRSSDNTERGSTFQTFPDTYKFFEDETKVSITKAARYIGNAVPPKLGEIIARSLKQNINSYKNV